jgi:fatty acid elongase 3
VIIHNSLLSIGSAVLFFALLSDIIKILRNHSFFVLWCDPTGRHSVSGTIIFIYYMNYVFKYVELIDTVLLALRGKPIQFLHIYHHAATLILCWSQLYAQSCVQWLPIVINLFVHVVMYAYYALYALRIQIWWKKYLTQLQIIQFVVALIGCFSAFGTRIVADYSSVLGKGYSCWGSYQGATIGCFVISSYLYLFILFFRETYRKRRSIKPGTENATAGRSNGIPSKANGHSRPEQLELSS